MTTDRLEDGMPSDLLNSHIEEFLGQLRTAGYAERTIRKKRLIVAAFARWMKLQRIALDRLVDSDIVAFVKGCPICLLHTSLKGNGYEDDEGLHCRAISGRDANGSRARADKSRCS